MKTTYDYTIKTILETKTIITVDTVDIEVPIISNNFEPVLDAGMTAQQKTDAKTSAKQSFKEAIQQYMIAYFKGKDTEAQPISISPTLLTIQGQTFTLKV